MNGGCSMGDVPFVVGVGERVVGGRGRGVDVEV